MSTRTRREREHKRVSARRRVEQHQSGSGSSCIRTPEGVNFFKVDKPGIRLIDIMPYVTKLDSKYADAGDLYYERTYWAHRSVGPNQEMVICPAKTLGKPCPICEHRAKLSNDPNADEDMIAALAPKERQLFLVRDLKDPDRGLQLWDVSFHLFGKLLDERIRSCDDDERDLWDGFANLDEGSTLRCSFTEETFAGRNFQKCAAIDLKPRKVQYDAADIEEHPCLDDLLVIRSYEELKKLFLQVDTAVDDDDDEEEYAQAKRPATKKVRHPVDDDEDEPPVKRKASAKATVPWDNEEGDEDEEDEEEAAPKKAKSKPAPAKATKKKVEEDELEDDVEDEDEEDEAPKRSAKAGKAAASGKKKKDDDWDDDWE